MVAIEFALFFLLLKEFEQHGSILDASLAKFLSLLAANVLGYFVHSLVTFRLTIKSAISTRRVSLFLVTQTMTALLSLTSFTTVCYLANIQSEGMFIAANAFVIIVFAVIRFSILDKLVFGNHSLAERANPESEG